MGKLKAGLHIVDAFNECGGKAISFLLVFLGITIIYEVVVRGIFNTAVGWSYELSTDFFGAYVILGGAYALRHDAHVKMDVAYNHFPPRVKAIADLVTSVLFFFFCGLLLVKGWDMAYASVATRETFTGQGWDSPLYLLKMTIPLAAFLILIQGLVKFIRDLATAIKGEKII